jgi:hypothetical protein
VSGEMSIQMSSYWNRIAKIPSFEACKLFKSVNKGNAMPIVLSGLNEYKSVFAGLPQTCPILPGKYAETNRTISMYGFINLPENPIMDKFNMPNGRHKVDVRLFTRNNSSSFYATFIIEIRDRLGEDKI